MAGPTGNLPATGGAAHQKVVDELTVLGLLLTSGSAT